MSIISFATPLQPIILLAEISGDLCLLIHERALSRLSFYKGIVISVEGHSLGISWGYSTEDLPRHEYEDCFEGYRYTTLFMSPAEALMHAKRLSDLVSSYLTTPLESDKKILFESSVVV
jgi:hypothetical protein